MFLRMVRRRSSKPRCKASWVVSRLDFPSRSRAWMSLTPRCCQLILVTVQLCFDWDRCSLDFLLNWYNVASGDATCRRIGSPDPLSSCFFAWRPRPLVLQAVILTGWYDGREHPAEDTLAKQIRSLTMHLGCPEKRKRVLLRLPRLEKQLSQGAKRQE